MLMAQYAVHSSTLMDHVLLLVLLTIQPVVIPTTLVLLTIQPIITLPTTPGVCSKPVHILHYKPIKSFSECSLPCPLGHQPNSSCSGCVPVHICLTNAPCQNGATCNIGTNCNTDYTCSCVQNFSGKNCTGENNIVWSTPKN